MKNRVFWIISMCFLILLATQTGLSIPLRIAIAANAIAIIIDVIKRLITYNFKRSEN